MFDLKDLTEREGTTLTNGLTVAAERFIENARELRRDATIYVTTRPSAATGFLRLAEQFERQAADTRALVERIDDALYGD